MNRLLFQILFKHQQKRAVILAFLGMLIGLSLIVFSLSLFQIISDSLKKDSQIFSSDFIIINKKLSLLNTLSFANAEFSKEEIQEIKNQDFVSNLAPFISNRFKIGAYTEATPDVPGFYTELFFQAVPDKYLNINDKRWKWEDGQKEIPIIFPGDYLKLYNFGFANSQGLPQVSAQTISRIAFKVKIKGPNGNETFSARVIGVTDKVNTILVPLDFMNWANERYGEDEKIEQPSMLLMETPNASNPDIFSFIEEKNYETNLEKVKNSKSSLFLKVLLSIVVAIGVIIVLLSLIMFILSIEILILRASEDLKRLFNLGLTLTKISGIYRRIMAVMLLLLSTLVYLLVYFALQYVMAYMQALGFTFGHLNAWFILISVLSISLLMFGINAYSIRIQLRRINGF